MAVKISNINMKAGESIFIGRNSELNILIKARKNKLIISSPTNGNCKIFEITIYGWKEVSDGK